MPFPFSTPPPPQFAVARHFSQEKVEPFQSGKSALAFPVCVSVVDEATFKNRADDVAERMVNDPVPEMRCADFPSFRVADCERGERTRLVCVRKEFPLELEEFVIEVLFKFENIGLSPFALLCFLEGFVEIVVAAELFKEIAIGFHAIPRSASWSHFETVGRMVVGIDVPAVVVVVEVVVAAGQKAYRSPFTSKLPLRLYVFSFHLLCIAAVFHGWKTSAVKGRVTPRLAPQGREN